MIPNRLQFVDRARRGLGAGETVLLAGPAGIGKSFIAREAIGGLDPAVAQCLAAFEPQSLRPLAHAIGAPFAGGLDDIAADISSRLDGRPLVVEDLHWADERTVQVVRRLVGRVPMLVTSRERATLAGLDGVTVIDIPPLDRNAAGELAQRVHLGLSAADRASLVDSAAGNPLLILQLANAERVSPTLTDAVGERLSRARPGTVQVLARLALHGRPAPRYWVALADTTDAEGMVMSVGDHHVWFVHELFAREVLTLLDSEQLDDERRRLVELSGDADAARHLLALGEFSEAARTAQRAATDADPQARADLLALAVDAYGDGAPVELRLEAADAMLVAHRTADARRLVEPIGRDCASFAQVALRRARAAWLDGRVDEALAEAEAAVESAEGSGSVVEVEAVVERALLLVRIRVGDPDIIAIADEALAMARARGIGVARALNASGLARSHTGLDGWRERFAEARSTAEAAGDVEEELAANYWIVSSLGFYGPMTDAATLGDEMVDRTEQSSYRRWHHHFLGANVLHRFVLGLLDEDRRAAALRLLENEPLFRNRAQVELALVAAFCDLDRPDEAAAILENGRRFVRNNEDAALIATTAAELALHRRDAVAMQAAIDHLAEVGAGFFGLNVLLESAAIHLAVAGPLSQIPSYSSTLTPTLGVVATERVAHEHQIRGDLVAASLAMQAAAEAWLDGSMRRFAQRAFLSAGRLAVAAGQFDSADDCLRRAWEVADGMNQRPAQAGFDDLRREIDRARDRSLLTTRETEVLLLVGVGRTTREIAAQLGISETTVESHVADGVRRLGCTTRRQAAARIV